MPVGYAFGAGMVSTVNPCGFAMLPAYLSLYLGTGHDEVTPGSKLQRGGMALAIGFVVTAGFILLFSIVGAAIAAGGQFIVQWMPFAGLAMGIGLAAAGVMLFAGKHLYAGLFPRLASRMGNPRSRGVRTFFLFGIAYAVASLGCTLPVFLVVVGSAVAVQGVFLGFIQFVSYGLGMGVVFVALTLGMALFKGGVVGRVRKLLPYIEKASAAIMTLAGAYLIYYWLTIGGVLSRFS